MDGKKETSGRASIESQFGNRRTHNRQFDNHISYINILIELVGQNSSDSILCPSRLQLAAMANFGTPKKPSSDVCRICGTQFRKDRRDKVSLSHTTARLHSLLQEATAFAVHEDDGFPQFVCTTCRNQLLKFERLHRQLEETRTLLCGASRCAFFREKLTVPFWFYVPSYDANRKNREQ